MAATLVPSRSGTPERRPCKDMQGECRFIRRWSSEAWGRAASGYAALSHHGTCDVGMTIGPSDGHGEAGRTSRRCGQRKGCACCVGGDPCVSLILTGALHTLASGARGATLRRSRMWVCAQEPSGSSRSNTRAVRSRWTRIGCVAGSDYARMFPVVGACGACGGARASNAPRCASARRAPARRRRAVRSC